MRQKQVWRYYCDHCNKGGCGKGAMLKHEKHCIRNPERACRMCEHGGTVTHPMPELIEALQNDGLKGLKDLTEACPACMLAAIVQERQGENGGHGEGYDFDYKAACVEFWASVESNRGQY